MSSRCAIGQNRTLGVTWRLFEPGIGRAFIEAASFKELHNNLGIRSVVNRILDRNPGKIHVVEDSNFHAMICDMGVIDRVTVCKRDEVEKIVMTKKNFVFVDTDEYAKGIGDFFFSVFLFRPPNLLSFQHLYVLMHHFDRIQKIAEVIDEAAEKDNKKTLLFAGNYFELVVVDLLYLLCASADIVAKLNHRLFFSTSESDTPISVTAALRDTHVIVIWNQNDFEELIKHRMFLQTRYGFDVYFIHGEKALRSNTSFLHDPILFWGYPFMGTNRVQVTFSRLLPKIGFTFYDNDLLHRLLRNPGSDIPGSKRERQPEGYFRNGDIIDLYKILPLSSISLLHQYTYSMDAILKSTNAKLAILTRDFRDTVLSAVNRIYASEIRLSNVPARNLFKKAMGTDHDFVNYYYMRYSISDATKMFVELRNNQSNVCFIKFEDINQDPFSAYHSLFMWLGIADDPFYDVLQMKPIIERAANAAHPKNLVWHSKDREWSEKTGKKQLVSGTSGKWKDFFDEEMKEYFKANSNGYLQCFGYEKDDNW